MKYLIYSLALTIVVSCSSSKNRRNESVFKKVQAPKTVRLYDGPELPREKVVRIISEQVDSHYMYFISVNDEKIKNKSLMDGPREILLKPGSHTVQMRFISKGKLAIPLKPFSKINFKEGRTYIVKSRFVFGKGNYISSAKNTKITVWIEEARNSQKLGLMTLNGFGR